MKYLKNNRSDSLNSGKIKNSRSANAKEDKNEVTSDNRPSTCRFRAGNGTSLE